jgi:hypothetical protein
VIEIKGLAFYCELRSVQLHELRLNVEVILVLSGTLWASYCAG